ncbi:MAG: type II toxin-antitoxin system VapC family toxin [Gammaproteobacteria bacterium]|nr:type II toxin-antitoxin system VapC family toxin [Gammaproteobacteria bacterium]
MSKMVLDASALLALINDEPGSDMVLDALPGAVMSAVNLSEVVAVLIKVGMPDDEACLMVNSLVNNVVPFDRDQAHVAAKMRRITKDFGLSLGDRACLALAQQEGLEVLTADKIWKQVSSGVVVRIIR